MKNLKKYVTLQIVVSVLMVGIITGMGHAMEADMETLYTYAKEAKIDWEQAKGETIHIITPPFYAMEYIGTRQAKVFEKLTGARVIWEFYPPEEAKTKAKVDLAAGAGKLDLPFTTIYRLEQYMRAGWLEPLDLYFNDPKLTDREWYNKDDFIPSILGAAQYGGKQYGFPIQGESNILFYRKDIFEEKGLMVPLSLDDYMTCAEKIHNPPEIYGVVMRTARGAGVVPYDWCPVFGGSGGKFFADFPRDLTPTVNSPEGLAAMKWYVDLVKYTPPGGTNMGWPEEQAAAQQGICGMLFDGFDMAFQFEDPAKSKTAGKWGYAPMPYGPGGRMPILWACYFPINAKSKNKIASWLLIELVTSPLAVYQREGAERTSIYKEVLKKGTAMGVKGDWILPWAMALATDLAMADPIVIPLVPEYGEYADRIGIRVNEAVTGLTDPKTAIDKLQEDFERIFVKK